MPRGYVGLLEDAALADIGLDEDRALRPHLVQPTARALVEAVDALLAVDAATLRRGGLIHRARLLTRGHARIATPAVAHVTHARLAVRRFRLADLQGRLVLIVLESCVKEEMQDLRFNVYNIATSCFVYIYKCRR